MEQSQYKIYRSVLTCTLADQESLPSLPAITLKIRQAIAAPDTTAESLAQLLSSDPGLSALLMKAVSSSIYRTAVPPNTLAGVISLMGFSAVANIVMAHSINSLFVFNKPALKKLYSISRNRQVVKGAMSLHLARKLGYRPPDAVLMSSMLSEVGTLALISAFRDLDEIPDTETYFSLCRNYSKSLGAILLTKWNIDSQLINAIKHCGDWHYATDKGRLTLLDVLNLALYHTVKQTAPGAELPAIEELPAYKKLTPQQQTLTGDGRLALVQDGQDTVQEFIQLLT